MVGRQAVHKDGGVLGLGHQRGVDLIGGQRVDALLPYGGRFAHADPHIGVDGIGPGCGIGVFGQGDAAAAQAGKLLTAGNKLGVRPVGLRRAGHKMQAHLGAADHQAVAHVVAGVTHVDEL